MPNRFVIHDARHSIWLDFSDPLIVLEAHETGDVIPLISEIEKWIKTHGGYAVGFLSYEAAPAFDDALRVSDRDLSGFPLVWFGVYGDPEVIHLSFPFEKVMRNDVFDWSPSITAGEYRKAIKRVKEYIGAGDTYQVNFSYRLRTPFNHDPWLYFLKLVAAQNARYAAYAELNDRWAICSASPEMFFQVSNKVITSRPMKGTTHRGLTLSEDLSRADWLRNSIKNRAENVMIVDMVRNDIGKIARTGSVRVESLFDVERYPTLWQMTSTVRGETDANLCEILRAMFPAASITGAPKARTMEIIAELESSPRRIYTGSIGFVTPDLDMQFNVAIRTVLIDRGAQSAEYGVGGGIVWDSDAADEFEECRVKTKVLERMMPEFQLIESILWTPEDGYYLLDYHMKRLAESAQYFSFRFDPVESERLLKKHAEKLPPLPHKVRLLLNRDGKIEIKSVIINDQWDAPKLVCLARQPINSSDPFLYHKTTRREIYERNLAENPECHSVILWNERGEVTEGCSANVIVEIDGKLYTPPVNSGLLPGTFRAAMIDSGRLSERVIKVSDLERCDRIFLANSVRGMYEVKLISTREDRNES